MNNLNAPLYSKMNDLKNELRSMTSKMNKQSADFDTSLTEKTQKLNDLSQKIVLTKSIKLQQKDLRNIVDDHQRFLEKTDSFRRENNVFVFGIDESDNDGNR